jgi:hypothetical protein
MSGGWLLFLFLFILGITAQTFNQFEIWDQKYPESGFTMDQSVITSSQKSATESPMLIFVIYEWTKTFVTIIGSGILAVLSLGGLFYALGWPVNFITIALLQLIQLPANLIIFSWLFELWTGRSIG